MSGKKVTFVLFTQLVSITVTVATLFFFWSVKSYATITNFWGRQPNYCGLSGASGSYPPNQGSNTYACGGSFPVSYSCNSYGNGCCFGAVASPYFIRVYGSKTDAGSTYPACGNLPSCPGSWCDCSGSNGCVQISTGNPKVSKVNDWISQGYCRVQIDVFDGSNTLVDFVVWRDPSRCQRFSCSGSACVSDPYGQFTSCSPNPCSAPSCGTTSTSPITPGNWATNVPVNTGFSWSVYAPYCINSFNVYLFRGNCSSDSTCTNTNLVGRSLGGTTTSTSLSSLGLNNLDPNTQYTWRVNVYNSANRPYIGPFWHFTTGVAPPTCSFPPNSNYSNPTAVYGDVGGPSYWYRATSGNATVAGVYRSPVREPNTWDQSCNGSYCCGGVSDCSYSFGYPPKSYWVVCNASNAAGFCTGNPWGAGGYYDCGSSSRILVNPVNAYGPADIIANGSTQYSFSVSAENPSGGDNVTDILLMINYQNTTDFPGTASRSIWDYRGILGWSKDGTFPDFGGTYTSVTSCSGGGYAAIYTGSWPSGAPGAGYQYVNLTGCYTGVDVNGHRSRQASFYVSFNPSYTTPPTNTKSGWMRSETGTYGWVVSPYTFCLKVNGGWSPWSNATGWYNIGGCGTYSACQQYQGLNQTRTCTNPVPACNGAYCGGSSTQTINQFVACGTVNGVWGPLTPATCPVSCGGGIQVKNCSTPACGGSWCTREAGALEGAGTIATNGIETFSCNTQSCCAANYGQPCTSAPNNCGETNSGTYLCNGTCSATTPVNRVAPAPPAWCSPSGTISPGVRNMAWQSVPGVSTYYVRMDDQTDPWYTPGFDVYLDNYAGTTYSYNFQAGHTYNMWVHSIGACPAVYSGIVQCLISVSYPTCTGATPATTDWVTPANSPVAAKTAAVSYTSTASVSWTPSISAPAQVSTCAAGTTCSLTVSALNTTSYGSTTLSMTTTPTSSPACVNKPICVVQKPGVPTSPIVSGITTNNAALSWTAPAASSKGCVYNATCNNCSYDYYIAYGLAANPTTAMDGSSWQRIGSMGTEPTLSYAISGLSCGTTYYYQIKRGTGYSGVESGWGASGSFTTSPCIPPVGQIYFRNPDGTDAISRVKVINPPTSGSTNVNFNAYLYYAAGGNISVRYSPALNNNWSVLGTAACATSACVYNSGLISVTSSSPTLGNYVVIVGGNSQTQTCTGNPYCSSFAAAGTNLCSGYPYCIACSSLYDCGNPYNFTSDKDNLLLIVCPAKGACADPSTSGVSGNVLGASVTSNKTTSSRSQVLSAQTDWCSANASTCQLLGGSPTSFNVTVPWPDNTSNPGVGYAACMAGQVKLQIRASNANFDSDPAGNSESLYYKTNAIPGNTTLTWAGDGVTTLTGDTNYNYALPLTQVLGFTPQPDTVYYWRVRRSLGTSDTDYAGIASGVRQFVLVAPSSITGYVRDTTTVNPACHEPGNTEGAVPTAPAVITVTATDTSNGRTYQAVANSTSGYYALNNLPLRGNASLSVSVSGAAAGYNKACSSVTVPSTGGSKNIAIVQTMEAWAQVVNGDIYARGGTVPNRGVSVPVPAGQVLLTATTPGGTNACGVVITSSSVGPNTGSGVLAQ